MLNEELESYWPQHIRWGILQALSLARPCSAWKIPQDAYELMSLEGYLFHRWPCEIAAHKYQADKELLVVSAWRILCEKRLGHVWSGQGGVRSRTAKTIEKCQCNDHWQISTCQWKNFICQPSRMLRTGKLFRLFFWQSFCHVLIRSLPRMLVLLASFCFGAWI